MSALQETVQVEDGQFDDAPDDNPPSAPVDARAQAGHRFIDEENILEWSSDSDEEEEDEFDAEEDDMEAAAFQELRAEDEDWEIAERGAFNSSMQGHEETKVSN